ncbi:MAG: His/Gly/Thr/Pro-type tRNA ligase C-terminal domain-containing protein, partial [Thiovulaceae bacterium]|nr:His/Gly/Thr/Pro-type tRNA ligase C-terminal domain-containing protein [Sulfurimonadaceae bacterium]
PDVTNIEELAGFFKIDAYYTMKCVAKRMVYDDGEQVVLFFLRGDDELQEVKAVNAAEALDIADVSEEELTALGLVPGFIGPLDMDKVPCVFDSGLKDAKQLICGANEKDYHYVGVEMSVLKEALFADLYSAREGDGCPHCSGSLLYKKGIEVGHIFKLGTTYSKPLKAEFLNERGQAKPFVMGTYGMGVSRLIAATIEQHHDEKGCIWTKETAPYMVDVMVSNIKDEAQLAFGEALYLQLQNEGVEVIFDDRKERFGFKMKDAELIGFPYTIIVGKELENGNVQIVERANLQKSEVASEAVFDAIMERLK